ncbi:MAG: zinc-binding alcohol dehydrogenase family protein [Candidatus Korobacteraceae bacterium]|jgi:NADPH2:quinone reductase
MNAAVLHTLGKPPGCEPFPEPIPGEGEVIVHVRAAALKPVDKQMASGSHYASFRELPVVCGLDGVGNLDDGTRVFFAAPRRPHGAMAQRTVVARSRCWPLPDDVEDVGAAAIVNPGVSAWLTLLERAKLAKGDHVLVLGATGTTGRLAVQIAKLLGAGRVVAAGRDESTLNRLHDLGADSTIPLNQPTKKLVEAFTRQAGARGFNVVIDYLWGHPTEAFLSAITGGDFAPSGSIRLVQAGESAGPTISLSAAALRSSGLEIFGSGSGAAPPLDRLLDAYHQVLSRLATGELRIQTESVPLTDVEIAWERASRARLVIIP